MKARKLPSGKWQTQVLDYIDAYGKRHVRSFTAATKAEAEFMAAKFKTERTEGGRDGAVADMVERTIRQKAGTLSPATLRGYEKIYKNQIKDAPFGRIRVAALTTDKVQLWISWMMARGLSPKSIKNAIGLFTSCYQYSGGEKTFRVKLPPARNARRHVPSIGDVEAVMRYFKDDPDMTAAIRLCAFASLRRGEICALTARDVDRKNRRIIVDKAVTETPSGEWILKQPKTAASVRAVPVSQFVIDALPKSGKIVSIPPSQITNRFCRAVQRLKVTPFTFHDLRHFYASLAHNCGVSDITIQASAGWASSATMKNIYFGEISEETARQVDVMNLFIEKTFRSSESQLEFQLEYGPKYATE